MSMHRPGATTRQFDVRALRAWIAAGRPAPGPRDWYHRRPPRRHAARPRGAWPYRNVLAFMVAVFVAGFTVRTATLALDNRPAGHIRPMTTQTQEVTR